jgi:hypothetical protein
MLWSLPTFPGMNPVSSAVRGLTALFGMGRGEHPPYRLHKGLVSDKTISYKFFD